MYKKILSILILLFLFSAINPEATLAIKQNQGNDIISHVNSNIGKPALPLNKGDLAAAKPMPLRIKNGQVPPDSGKDMIAPPSSGTHHYSYPAKPGGDIQLIKTKNSSAVNYVPYTRAAYPPLFTRYDENVNVDTYPINTIGVLFFTQNGINYRCSAVLVYRNVVWTAGHCIHDGISGDAGWSENFVFYPAWKDGAANPLYGSYSNWTASFTYKKWMKKGKLGYDFGAVVFDDTVNGEYPGDTVGYLGFQTGQSEAQTWNIYGYPSETPFTGDSLVTCLTVFTRKDTSIVPATVGFGCDMTGGASGAPLVRLFSYDGAWVNGTYSYYYGNKTKEIFSPYFGDDAWNIFCAAAESDMGLKQLDHPNCP